MKEKIDSTNGGISSYIMEMTGLLDSSVITSVGSTIEGSGGLSSS